MDIALVTTRPLSHDATSNFTAATADALHRLGRGKVTIYAYAYERPYIDGVDVRFLGDKNAHSIGTNLRSLLRTRALAREFAGYGILALVNPDVGSMPAAHLARRYNPKLKILWVFHGLTPTGLLSGFRDRTLMRVRRVAYRMSMKRSDLIQVFSQHIKGELAQSGIGPSKVVVMPFGIDIGKFSSGDGRRVRARLGLEGKFVMLYVGRLASSKRIDELVRAVSMGDDRACLVVVGSGPERQPLESLSKKLGVWDRVTFAGRVPDEELPDFYAACDVWVTASRHEGFCVPIVEAMAAGKPVVVPDVAAMPETADGGGLTYPAGDVESLKSRLYDLLQDKTLYKGLSARAKARASAFDMPSVMQQHVDFILSLNGTSAASR